jgi:hypothetical protein
MNMKRCKSAAVAVSLIAAVVCIVGATMSHAADSYVQQRCSEATTKAYSADEVPKNTNTSVSKCDVCKKTVEKLFDGAKGGEGVCDSFTDTRERSVCLHTQSTTTCKAFEGDVISRCSFGDYLKDGGKRGKDALSKTGCTTQDLCHTVSFCEAPKADTPKGTPPKKVIPNILINPVVHGGCESEKPKQQVLQPCQQ